MADVTLADALSLTRDRALNLAMSAITTASGAYDYTTEHGGLSQYFEFLLGSWNVLRTGQGSNKQKWTFKADLRFKVGAFTENFDGQIQQQAAYLYAPTAAQMFEQYRGLNDPNDPYSQRVPYLNVDETFLSNGRLQMIGNDEYIIMPFVLVYDTMFARCGL